MHLIQTKFHRPQANANLVQRPHLLTRLNAGLSQQLVLVSAPPGFGKTTLVSQWLDNCETPFVWVSLDDGDNHLPQFLSYLCAAVCRRVPDACSALQGLLTTVHLPDADHLGDLLVEELNALPTELILVLDDYHRIRSSTVHQMMRHLLRYLPPRLHLVVLTRTDPPFYLGRMRAGQQVAEIRGAELRFDLAESRHFLQDHAGQSLDDEVVRSLQARTEGWIIGLKLASISLQRQSSDQFMVRFGGSDRLLAGYLVEEVLASLPEAMIEFLTRTALVDRFSVSLGDALMADSQWPAVGRTMIEQLEAQNLFIVPLDNEGNWYRYHDLFRDFLLHRLKHEKDEAGLAGLHWRASQWLAQAGLIDDALHHALASGREQDAGDLVEINLHPLLNRGIPGPVLERWLDLFPEPIIHSHPGLLTAQILLFSYRWDMQAIPPTMDRAVQLAQVDDVADGVVGELVGGVVAGGVVSEERRQVRLAVLEMLQAFLSYQQGDVHRAVPLFQRGLKNLKDPLAHAFVHAESIFFLIQAYAGCGHWEDAVTLLRTALAEATAHHRPTMMIFLGSRVQLYFFAGNLDEAANAAGHLLSSIDAWQAHPSWSGVATAELWRGWAHHFLGSICYERNELEAAASHWRTVEAMRYRVNLGAYQAALIGLAFVAQAQQSAAEALVYAQAARDFAVEVRSLALLAYAEALDMRLALLGDAQADAQLRSQEVDMLVNQSNTIWPEQPRLAVVRVLLAKGTTVSHREAQQLVENYLRQAEDVHNTRQIIPLLALHALVWHGLGHTVLALDALERALDLGEAGKFTRAFLDLGAPMAELLRLYECRRGSSAAVKRLLTAFAREPDMVDRRQLTDEYMRLHDVTPLTRRELELMVLIGKRLSVNEMAEQLVISPNTVKKHVSSIYAKLGVNSRRQAIAKAEDVGLLPLS